MLFEVDSEAQAPAPLRPKSPQTSSAASDRKSALQLWCLHIPHPISCDQAHFF
jgi:hypothetical protein